uniref:Uncharacterized protein n=1 Tax=Spodoptera frugiperda nuclear polyhedrosis virus TaxID=10455 RepID=A0A7G3W7H0_NPVSF|nr:hypothetical protein [Spodoptera frugiperda multiple nucleopolyhedrovirus]
MNKYSKCYFCEEMVYLHKKYTNTSSDKFFNRFRAIIKNNKIMCIECYKDIFLNNFNNNT